MNEKLAVLAKRASNIAAKTSVPSAFENEPASLLDPSNHNPQPSRLEKPAAAMTRSRFFNITASLPKFGPYATAVGLTQGDLKQVAETAEALAIANMSLEPIPNHFRELEGFQVEEGEVDAPIQKQEKPYGVRRDEQGVTAWRETGETVRLSLLPPTNPIIDHVIGHETIPSQQLPTQEGLRVIEGLRVGNVSNPQVAENPNPFSFVGKLTDTQLAEAKKPA